MIPPPYSSVAVTEIVNTFPVFTGFGVMVIALITGADVLYVTVLVTVVDLPAASVAITVMVFVPLVRVTTWENVPLDVTVTASPLMVGVTGEGVASFVVPVTVTVD